MIFNWAHQANTQDSPVPNRFLRLSLLPTRRRDLGHLRSIGVKSVTSFWEIPIAVKTLLIFYFLKCTKSEVSLANLFWHSKNVSFT